MQLYHILHRNYILHSYVFDYSGDFFVPKWKEQYSQCTHNVTLSRVRATIVAVEEK